MKWGQVKAGDTIRVHGEKVKVKAVRTTEGGERRVTLEGKGSPYQEIRDPNQDVK